MQVVLSPPAHSHELLSTVSMPVVRVSQNPVRHLGDRRLTDPYALAL